MHPRSHTRPFLSPPHPSVYPRSMVPVHPPRRDSWGPDSCGDSCGSPLSVYPRSMVLGPYLRPTMPCLKIKKRPNTEPQGAPGALETFIR